jgi:ribosome biogenesis GTPase
MRELGLAEDTVGLGHLFADIAELAAGCRFRDCEHQGEPGCAVVAAVENGALDGARLASFHHLQREIAAAERRRDPVLGRNAKRRWKSIHKAMRSLSRMDPKWKR